MPNKFETVSAPTLAALFDTLNRRYRRHTLVQVIRTGRSHTALLQGPDVEISIPPGAVSQDSVRRGARG